MFSLRSTSSHSCSSRDSKRGFLMASPSPTWSHLCTTVKGCHGRTLMPLTLVLTSGVMTVSLRYRISKTLRRPVVGDTWWHQIRTESPIFMLMFCLPVAEPQAFGHTGPEPQTLSTNILLLQEGSDCNKSTVESMFYWRTIFYLKLNSPKRSCSF